MRRWSAFRPLSEKTNVQFTIGSRTRGERESGSMSFQQSFAGRAVGFLLRLMYSVTLRERTGNHCALI